MITDRDSAGRAPAHLASEAQSGVGPDVRDRLPEFGAMAGMRTRMIDRAAWLWVMNPRAMSPRVTGFAQAQTWVQDLTRVRME